jgi:hypothetical protein
MGYLSGRLNSRYFTTNAVSSYFWRFELANCHDDQFLNGCRSPVARLHHWLDTIFLCLNASRCEAAVGGLRSIDRHSSARLEQAEVAGNDLDNPDIRTNLDLLLTARILEIESSPVRSGDDLGDRRVGHRLLRPSHRSMSLTGTAHALGQDVYLLGVKLAVRISDRGRAHEIARFDVAEGFIGKRDDPHFGRQ